MWNIVPSLYRSVDGNVCRVFHPNRLSPVKPNVRGPSGSGSLYRSLISNTRLPGCHSTVERDVRNVRHAVWDVSSPTYLSPAKNLCLRLPYNNPTIRHLAVVQYNLWGVHFSYLCSRDTRASDSDQDQTQYRVTPLPRTMRECMSDQIIPIQNSSLPKI